VAEDVVASQRKELVILFTKNGAATLRNKLNWPRDIPRGPSIIPPTTPFSPEQLPSINSDENLVAGEVDQVVPPSVVTFMPVVPSASPKGKKPVFLSVKHMAKIMVSLP